MEVAVEDNMLACTGDDAAIGSAENVYGIVTNYKEGHFLKTERNCILIDE